VLRVSHPLLQLHVLKLIKSQVPFCGRKWRQCMCDDFSCRWYTYPVLANMKVITSIYLKCRPDLRDEWLTGTEVDDISDAQVRMSLIMCDICQHTSRPKNKPCVISLSIVCHISALSCIVLIVIHCDSPFRQQQTLRTPGREPAIPGSSALCQYFS